MGKQPSMSVSVFEAQLRPVPPHLFQLIRAMPRLSLG